jgi:hypothetical protein
VSTLTILEFRQAVHDPPPALRGPRIGRPGKPPVRVQGIAPERVVLSTELDPYLSLRALAGYSGLSVRKLRDLLAEPGHPLPCYRIGGKIVVRRSEYDRWAAHHRQVGNLDVDNIVSGAVRDLHAVSPSGKADRRRKRKVDTASRSAV